MANPLEVKRTATDKDAIRQRAFMAAGIIPIHPSITGFCGSAGGGKTTLAMHLLKEPMLYGPSMEGVHPEERHPLTGKKYKTPKPRGYFDEVFLFIGSSDDLFRGAVDLGIIKKHNVFHPATIGDVQSRIDAQNALIEKHGNVAKAPKLLWIFDDMANDRSFMESKAMKALFIKSRHLNSSVWILSQYLHLIAKSCRQQMTTIFMFKMGRSELKVLEEEYCPAELTMQQFEQLCLEATSDDPDVLDDEGKVEKEGKKNNFLTIVKKAPLNKRYRRNLDVYLTIGCDGPPPGIDLEAMEKVMEKNAEALKKEVEEEAVAAKNREAASLARRTHGLVPTKLTFTRANPSPLAESAGALKASPSRPRSGRPAGAARAGRKLKLSPS